MNVTLVIDPDTNNQRVHRFDFDDAIDEIIWENFRTMPERLFAQRDAFVGDSVYPALFLNRSALVAETVSILADGSLYVTVITI